MIFLLDAKGEKVYHIKNQLLFKIFTIKNIVTTLSLNIHSSVRLVRKFPRPSPASVIVIRLSLDPFERREGTQNVVLSNLEEEVKQCELFLYSVWLNQVSDTPFFPLNFM